MQIYADELFLINLKLIDSVKQDQLWTNQEGTSIVLKEYRFAATQMEAVE